MSVVQPVILSGGSGTRLWPASRATYPKQLLPIVNDKTMLQETALRLDGTERLGEKLVVVGNEADRFLVAARLREIGKSVDIVLEPEGRITAPAAALAAFLALAETKKGDDAPMLFTSFKTKRHYRGSGLGDSEASENAEPVRYGHRRLITSLIGVIVSTTRRRSTRRYVHSQSV